MKAWKIYEPMIGAIVDLFSPFVEAAVHDVVKGEVVALYNNISKRKVGDKSPLKELNIDVESFPDTFSPYYKKNWDGRALKCTSITIRNEKGAPIYLVCFNADVSVFQELNRFAETFLKIQAGAKNPIEIHGAECEEQATRFIQNFLSEKKWSLTHLNRSQKKELVQHLFQKGLFNFKNAAPFLAQYLKVSRASIYNYIKE